MIVFDYRLPSPGLREYVRQFQIVGFEFKESETVPWKPYWPRPETCLSFYPRKTEIIESADGNKEVLSSRAIIRGQYHSITNRQPNKNFVLFQVVFQPGALFRLTGIPVDLFTDKYIDAESVFQPEIGRVNERLSSTDNHMEMIWIVETFLYALVNQVKYDVKPVDKVSHYLLQNPNKLSFDWLADEACLSRKQFYRKFVERMGVSPKAYTRIIRFDQAVKIKNANPELDWLSISLQAGYYDYQHMVKDFKEFTSLTPTEFYLMDSHAPERKFGKKET
ncbi:helix-turn-helix domain-containing protein [Rhodocytophaga rosea]|nr:helix-turn-helix domain-containing protein [Rhodocytophaga rosea]